MVSASPEHGSRDATRLARGGMLNLIGAVSSASLNLLLVVAVTRALSTAEAGAFFAVTSLFLIVVAVGRLGSGTGLVYFVARMRALDRGGAVGALLKIALVPVAGWATTLAIGLMVFAGPVADVIVKGDPGETATYLRIVALFLPFAAMLEGVLGATRGHGRMRPTVIVEKVLRPLVQLLGIVAIATLGAGAVVLAWTAPYLPALLAGGGWLHRLRSADRPSVVSRDGSSDEAAAGLRRDYWTFTAPRAVSGLMQVALQRIDVIIVAALLGAGPSALYVVATRLIVVGAFGTQAISMAVQPQVAGHYALDRLDAVNALYRTSTTWLMLATWPLYLLGIMFAPTILLVFGHEYAQASTVLVILSCASLLSTGCGVVDVMLTMAGRTRWILGNVTCALAVNVALNLLLVPSLGIEGAAWAWAAAIAVNNVLPLAQLFWVSRMHPFGSSICVAAGVVVLAYVPLGVGAVLLIGQGVSALLLTVVVGTGFYLGCLWGARNPLGLVDLAAALPILRRT